MSYLERTRQSVENLKFSIFDVFLNPIETSQNETHSHLPPPLSFHPRLPSTLLPTNPVPKVRRHHPSRIELHRRLVIFHPPLGLPLLPLQPPIPSSSPKQTNKPGTPKFHHTFHPPKSQTTLPRSASVYTSVHHHPTRFTRNGHFTARLTVRGRLRGCISTVGIKFTHLFLCTLRKKYWGHAMMRT